MHTSKKMIIVIAVVSLGFAGYLVFPDMNITAQEQPEVFVTHSGAVVQTTGDILDPVYMNLIQKNTYENLIMVQFLN